MTQGPSAEPPMQVQPVPVDTEATPAPVLLRDKSDGVLVLTLNRPEARNAISPELACRLADALTEAAADPTVRVVILTGAGHKAFCSGGDLSRTLPLMTGARTPEDHWDRRLLEEPDVIGRSSLREAFDKPVIAAVNGACLAGGMETMLATDIRVAADHAVFGLPEVTRGLVPFAGAPTRLPRHIPFCNAMELLLTGGSVSAAEALRMGLVNHVAPAGDVLGKARAIAERIAANGPVAVQRLKRLVRESSGLTLYEAFQLEDETKLAVMATDDAREGPRAFMEKRPTRFTGR